MTGELSLFSHTLRKLMVNIVKSRNLLWRGSEVEGGRGGVPAGGFITSPTLFKTELHRDKLLRETKRVRERETFLLT